MANFSIGCLCQNKRPSQFRNVGDNWKLLISYIWTVIWIWYFWLHKNSCDHIPKFCNSFWILINLSNISYTFTKTSLAIWYSDTDRIVINLRLMSCQLFFLFWFFLWFLSVCFGGYQLTLTLIKIYIYNDAITARTFSSK